MRIIVTTDQLYSAFGWDREGIHISKPCPKPALSQFVHWVMMDLMLLLHWERQNIPDFIKESVAVVTNPAIDRDREMEHFSTRIIAGPRPPVFAHVDNNLRLELLAPLVLEGTNGVDSEEHLSQPSFEQLLALFRAQGDNKVAVLSTTFARGTSLK